MCTAAAYCTKDFYFGRTLDYEISYGEEVTVTPRSFPLRFRNIGIMGHHYAMIGMAHVAENYPLYYDAINEKGLGMTGLNFVGNAYYGEKVRNKENIIQFELIPWILSQCASVKEVRALLGRMNLVGAPFNDKLTIASLHWLIADRREAVTLEATKSGLHIYDNPVGILTNNPPFMEQMFQLNNYMKLSPEAPVNHFSDKLPLTVYSCGMGAMGLPGDWSSQSRFVRAAFVKMNAVCGDSEAESVSQFFHILGSVEQPRGCSKLEDGNYEVTLYTSCCNAEKGIYYYTTYDNHQITAVNMHQEKLDSDQLVRYPLIQTEQIRMQN